MIEPPADLKDVVLVTHKGCLDGSGCAIVFNHAGGCRDNIVYVAAGMVERFMKDEEDLISSDKFIIFADVAFSPNRYPDVLEKRGNCVVIDHHKTSAHLKGRDWCLIDCEGNGGSACGSKLLLGYLEKNINEMIDKFVDEFWKNWMWRCLTSMVSCIDDHDRWLQQDPRGEKLAMLMGFEGQKEFVERFIDVESRFDRFGPGTLALREEEELILEVLKRRRDENIDTALRKISVCDREFQGQKARVGYVISSESNSSLLMNNMLEKFPNIDVAAMVDLSKGTVSMRSRQGGHDCAEIAAMFGGGGHRGAAGHRIPPKLVAELIERVHSG